MPVTTSAILGGIQTASGIAQYIKGNQMAKKNKRPDYQVPQEISDNLSQAQMQALEGLSPEQKQQYVENVQRQQNFGLNAMGDRKAGISGLATLTQSGNDAYNNLLTQDSQARMQNQQGLMDARTEVANFKDKGFELNKLLPYQQKAEAATALKGAGIQTAVSGLSNLQNTYENQGLANAMGGGDSDLMTQFKIAQQNNPGLDFATFKRMNSSPTNTYR